MAEVLTESFCERCGSRYTFESAAPRVRLRSLKVVSRGLKTFVLDDKTSLDEAMASARSDTDRQITSSQLDAFHKTFNFCMQCRQYTCPNCWNEAEGRCLTCAPEGGQDLLSTPFPTLDRAPDVLTLPPARFEPPAPLPASANGHEQNGHDHVDDADRSDVLARLDALTMPAPTATPEPDVVAPRQEPEIVEAIVAAPEPEPEVVAEPASVEAAVEAIVAAPEPEPIVEASPEPIPLEAVERAAELAAQTRDLLAGLRPGQSLADAVDAFERDEPVVVEPAAVTPEPVVKALVAAPDPVTEPEPELVAEPEPIVEAFVAEPEPVVAHEPEPVVAEPEPEPVAEPVAAAPEAPVAPPLDVVEQPTWTIHAPDPSAQPDLAALPPAATSAPRWPVDPEWPAQQASPGLPFLNRPVVPTGGVDALWAESDRAVTADPGANRPAAGVQPCVSCGLSLSATARFCRRCGSAQG